MEKAVFICATAVFSVSPAAAAQIGPFGTLNGADAYWETGLVIGGVQTGTASLNSGQIWASPNQNNKLELLPWSQLGTYTQEKMTIARLNLSGAAVNNVHARVYDPATTGQHGWQVILRDDAGKTLWFGVEPSSVHANVGPGKIGGYQYDGSAWTLPGPYARNRTGNNYYTLDFAQAPDGRITSTIDAWENGVVPGFSGSSFTSAVAYGPITEVYLSTSTYNTTTATYKWIEFSAVPEPATLGLLGLGPLGLMRRRAEVWRHCRTKR